MEAEDIASGSILSMAENAIKRMIDSNPLRVLFSFGPSVDDANPYVDLLVESVSPHVIVHHFSWKFALLGSYDIFHIHWPEALTRRRTYSRSLAVRILALLLIAKLALFRIPIVRTEHNLRPHEKGDWVERAILDFLDRRTAAWILMNQAATFRPRQKVNLIVHGHYRDRYSPPVSKVKKTGSILNFGLIRPYKGVEDLVEAFKQLPDNAALTLTIMGKPHSAEIAAGLRQRIGSVGNIQTDFRHVPDDKLVASVSESNLVVLPYQSMHNSGVLLLALSLGTPVLVPRNEITDALALEVGEQWVQRFDGHLTPDAIVAASRAVNGLAGMPNLTSREWSDIGDKHADVYRRVVAQV